MVSAPQSLVIETVDGQRKLVPLDRDQITVGRGLSAELSYPDDIALSRQHFRFTRSGDDCFVEDLGSKNGTFLNGRKLDSRERFTAGDRVTAGRLIISLSGGSDEHTVLFVEPEPTATRSRTTIVADLKSVLMPAAHLGALDGGAGDKSVLHANPQIMALVRAGRELASMRPLAELFDLILGLAVDAVSAQRGVVILLENGELHPRAHRGEGFRISSAVRDRVLKKKESVLLRDAQLELDPSEQHTIIEQKVHSMLAVPLQTDDRVIGLIYADTPYRKREFTHEDLSLLTVMANVAAIRVEHARLAEIEASERAMEEELRQAANIQRNLLPTADPEVTGLDIAGSSLPCRGVGGDYYDYLPYETGELGLLVGDVAGKGISAALLMTSLQARVKVLLDEPDNWAARIARLNKAVCSNCPANRFITFFAAVVDPASGALRYVNAGHNLPLLIRASGDVQMLDTAGLVLGIFRHGSYQEATAQMNPGDTLVLFSDGVTEAVDPSDEEYGEKRLAALVSELRHLPAREISDRIHADLERFTHSAPARDDITLVVIRKL